MNDVDTIDEAAAEPDTAPPASDAERLIPQNRRRRARRRFNLAVLGVIGIIVWMAVQVLQPDVPKPVLSAKPAPSEPELAQKWTGLPPMQRRHSEDVLAEGDNLAALLARANVNAVEADAALDKLRDIFDVRRLKVGQKVRVFREWPASQTPNDGPGRFAGFVADHLPGTVGPIDNQWQINGPAFWLQLPVQKREVRLFDLTFLKLQPKVALGMRRRRQDHDAACVPVQPVNEKRGRKRGLHPRQQTIGKVFAFARNAQEARRLVDHDDFVVLVQDIKRVSWRRVVGHLPRLPQKETRG